MAVLKMVRYGRLTYPKDIPLHLQEVSGHFDVQPFAKEQPYSLHTEYSYGAREFRSAAIMEHSSIPEAQKNGIPQLWADMYWAADFAVFIHRLVERGNAPSVIEIHPPFKDCAGGMEGFLNSYSIFEKVMNKRFPETEIVIENRTGTRNRCGFLISTVQDLKELCQGISAHEMKLKIALDIPQILYAEKAHTAEQIQRVFRELVEIRGLIGSIHLWGRQKKADGRVTSHTGDLKTWFAGDEKAHQALLDGMVKLLDDDISRWLVLEVNSGEKDLNSIINDLKSKEIRFI